MTATDTLATGKRVDAALEEAYRFSIFMLLFDTLET
jgi:hypothetical protein